MIENVWLVAAIVATVFVMVAAAFTADAPRAAATSAALAMIDRAMYCANYVLRKLDILRVACVVMLGHKHKHSRHARLLLGLVFMALGVWISKQAETLHLGHYWEMCADGFGYFLHGMGLTPWLEVLTDVLDDGELTPEG